MLVSLLHPKDAIVMSRKEVIVLVSRAFAACQLATALLEISYLPERLFSMHHHASLVSVISVSAADSYWRTYDQIDILSLIARILGLLTLTVVFWRCGSWVERVVFSDQAARNFE
jgi:hypothetical protein